MEKETTEKETLDQLLRKVQGHPIQDRTGASVFEAVEGLEALPEVAPQRNRAELLRGVHLKVRAELGRTSLLLKDALQLSPGSLVDLEKLAEDPVDLYVNDLLIARGEVVVINDSFCIRITEVFSQGPGEEDA